MYDPLVRHNVGVLKDAGKSGVGIRTMTGASERTQRRIANEKGPVWHMSKKELARERGVGRPSVLDSAIKK